MEPNSYDANMRALATRPSTSWVASAAIIGPTPVDESKTRPVEYRAEREYRLDFVEAYNEIARHAAQDAGVRFVDLFEFRSTCEACAGGEANR